MTNTTQPLSYAGLRSRSHRNWPAIASVACALVPPTLYALYIHRFGTKAEASRGIWLINSGWAVSCCAATLLGIWGFYGSIRRDGRQHAWALLGLSLGLANAATFPLLRAYHARVSRLDSDYNVVRCRTNLYELFSSLDTYAADHTGRFPDRLDQLIVDGYVRNEYALTCPFPAPIATPAPTTQLPGVFRSRPVSNPYLYAAKGMSVTGDPKTVLVYEPLSNHPRAFPSVHFLFADGHVEAIAPREAKMLIQQLQGGVNPPKR